MTEYYKILNENDLILKENVDLRQFVQHLTCKISELNHNDSTRVSVVNDMPRLLQALIRSYKENHGKKKNGYRYKNELIQNFSTFTRDLAGRQTYEFWAKNLPLPSLSAVSRYSKEISEPVIEGEFRFEELKKHLDERNLGREVWLSEDGTRVTGRIQYDPSSNQIVGFVPDLDSNGVPCKKSFEATSSEVIQSYFSTKTCSNYAYVIMAQPLADVPPFCLSIFGTNNKFTGTQVLDRWKWMLEEAQKHGILVMGFSSDGDSRLLSAMKQWSFGRTTTDVLPDWQDFFFSPMDLTATENPSNEPSSSWPEVKPLLSQDIVHIGAKMKTQLLKDRSDSNFLPIGDYVVSGTFLHILKDEQGKCEHGLTKSVLDSKNKMNFKAVQQLIEDRVISGLDSIPASKGTKIYLTVLKGILDSFLDKYLEPSARVYQIWRSIFFLRFWRVWLKENHYKPSSHFLTSNTYQGIEINGHCLVNIIRRLRNQRKSHLFIPWRMSSQPCEGFFRDARSLSSSFSTVVNMSVLEFLQRTRKIERIAEVGHKLDKELIVPRHHKKMQEARATADRLTLNGLCSDADLLNAILKAQNDALSLASELGMKWDTVPKFTPASLGLLPRTTVNDPNEDFNSDAEEIETDELENEEIIISESEEMPPDVAEDTLVACENSVENDSDIPDIPTTSIFVVHYENGKRSVIRKSTLIWLLTSRKFQLSSDRTERVKAAEETLSTFSLSSTCSLTSQVQVLEELCLGTWCVFKNSPSNNHFFVGRILSFSYLSGKGNGRVYSNRSVPTSAPSENARGIGCLGVWFIVPFEGNGQLIPHRGAATHYDLQRYKCSLPSPNSLDGKLYFSQDVIRAVKKILKYRPKKTFLPSTKQSTSAMKTRSSK